MKHPRVLVGVSIYLGVAASLLFTGCDPGFSYHPDGWSISDDYQWARQFNDIKITTNGLGGFIGSDGIIPSFKIENYTSKAVILEGGELLVGKSMYPAELPGHGEAKWRTVNPGTSQRIPLYWTFEGPALDVLGSRPRIVLNFRQGDRPRRIEIIYTRSE